MLQVASGLGNNLAGCNQTMHVTHDYICRALHQMYQHCPNILLSSLVNTEYVYAVVVGL